MNEQEEVIRKKIEFFKNEKIAVHIEKYDGRFNNGIILEFVGDHIILDDEVLGAVPIYLLEIKFIEKRAEKNERRS